MSFSVDCRACGLEYSGRRPYAQRRNLVRPRFHALVAEIGRWLRTARRSLDEADYESHTLERYLTERALLPAVSRPLHRPAHVGALVDGPRPRP